MVTTLAVAIWLTCTSLGFVLIDLDAGPLLVPLTADHGLTVVDAAGAAALVAGWAAPMAIARRRLASYPIPAARPLVAGVTVVCAGVCLLIASILVRDFPGQSVVVAGLVLVVQYAGAAAVLARWRAETGAGAKCERGRTRGPA